MILFGKVIILDDKPRPKVVNTPAFAEDAARRGRKERRSRCPRIGEKEQQRSSAVAPATRNVKVTLVDLFVAISVQDYLRK